MAASLRSSSRAASKQRADRGPDYTADAFAVLDGPSAVRKRAGMYIGSTDSAGLTHCLFELIDNAVDEALGGYAKHVTVTRFDDGSWQVSDNGRGIPVDLESSTGLPAASVAFTKLHAGGKFSQEAYAVAGGLHGVGAAVVCALSTRLDLTVFRDRREHKFQFAAGREGVFDASGVFAPLAGKVRRAASVRAPAKRTGTTVRFWPDAEIFGDAAVDTDAVASRMRHTCALVAKLTMTLDLGGGDRVEFSSGGSIASLLTVDGVDREPLMEPLVLSGSGEFTEKAQVLDASGSVASADVLRPVSVDVALQWVDSDQPAVISGFVNVVSTPDGGTHVAALEKAVVKAVVDAVSSTRLVRSSDPALARDDVLTGLHAAVAVRLPEPSFAGQTKQALATAQVGPIVARTVSDGLNRFFVSRSAQTRSQSRAVLARVVDNARHRAANAEKRAVKRAEKGNGLPAKLADCRNRADKDGCELLLVEGDSAGGAAKAARDGAFQAVLPLRGKILNAQRSSLRQVLANAECAAVLAAVGAPDAWRYGRVVILTDADADGAHIRTLLLALLWQTRPELFEQHRVFAAVPPLYRNRTVDKVLYTHDESEQDDLLKRLARSRVKVHETNRFKGLGEMDASLLWETTLDPATRTLRKITAADAQAAAASLQRCLGDDPEARRQMLSVQ